MALRKAWSSGWLEDDKACGDPGNPGWISHAHSQEGVLHCPSSDRFTAVATALEAHVEDKEVADLFFGIREVSEGFGDGNSPVRRQPSI